MGCQANARTSHVLAQATHVHMYVWAPVYAYEKEFQSGNRLPQTHDPSISVQSFVFFMPKMNWNPVTFLIHIRESTNPHLNWSLKVHTYTKANENKKACVSNISRLVARTSFRDDLVNYAASRLAGWLAGWLATLVSPPSLSYVTIGWMNGERQKSCDLYLYIQIYIYFYIYLI